MSCSRLASLCLCLLVVLPIVLCHAAEPPRRAQPPRWSEEARDAFFDDARQHLIGSRPRPIAGAAAELLAAQPPGGLAQRPQGARKWPELIEGETLTTEIKRIHNQLLSALNSPAGFQGGGNRLCQRDFGLLAVLFGMVAEYDTVEFQQSERWQRSAKWMQNRCFQAGQNCQAASDQSFTAAKDTFEELGELIRGRAPAVGSRSRATDKPPLVERALLMQSMELALKVRLSPAVANAQEFRKQAQLALEQAQLLAALAEVVQQAGYEYADDDPYVDEARQLGDAARQLAEASREKDYEGARAALRGVSQSCSRCHEGYRG